MSLVRTTIGKQGRSALRAGTLRGSGPAKAALYAAVVSASLAFMSCGSEADDQNWWADAGPGTGGGPSTGIDALKGFWVWEKRVQGDVAQAGEVDKGLMRMAFGTGNDKCHYIWNEMTGSDFQTECTYTIAGDMVTFHATADPDGTAAGFSCAHADWTSWNDRPAVQYSRYKFVGDRLWMGVNTYWGFGGNVTLSDGTQVPGNNSLKRFPFWESLGQAEKEESWIVFKPVTQAEWCTDCNQPEMCTQ